MRASRNSKKQFLNIVKEKTRTKTVAEIARRIQREYTYVYSVLTFSGKSSRKLIFEIAQAYHVPDLLYLYEQFLRDMVENKRKKSTEKTNKEV